MDRLIEDLRVKVDEGMSQSEAIASMRSQGLSIIHAVKATRELFCISLGDAKHAVASHPAYAEIATASEPLHDEAIQAFQDVCIPKGTQE